MGCPYDGTVATPGPDPEDHQPGGHQDQGRPDPPVVLSIAGSDSGAGAGIQADLKTLSALGVFATTAVTVVTAQNTAEVRDVLRVPPSMVDSQLSAVLDDLAVRAVKTGLLATTGVVDIVAHRAASGDLPNLVVDPVLVSSNGQVLVDRDGIEAYRRRLLPHALVATPNLWEAELLAGGSPPASWTSRAWKRRPVGSTASGRRGFS